MLGKCTFKILIMPTSLLRKFSCCLQDSRVNTEVQRMNQPLSLHLSLLPSYSCSYISFDIKLFCSQFFSSCSHFGAYSWFLSFLIILQTVGFLVRVISSPQGLYLYTGQHRHRKTRTYTSNIHALIGIRTYDPGFRASEESTCLRPLGYRDRPAVNAASLIICYGYRNLCRTWFETVKK
jgi:hypothetical protein